MSNNTACILNTCVTCSSKGSQITWVVFHFLFVIGYSILFSLSVFSAHKIRKSTLSQKLRSFIPRIILCITLLLKSILLVLEASMYISSSYWGFWKKFIILFPGYVVTTTYLIILSSWFDLFGTFMGGNMQKFFKISNYFIFSLAFGFPILFFITIGFIAKGIHQVCSENLSNSKTLDRAIESEYIIAMIRDLLVAVFYVIMFLLIRIKLQLKMTCSKGTSEQILYRLCLLVSIALIIRFIVRVVFSTMKMNECSIQYLIIYIFKEVIGQFLPIMFAIIEDLKTIVCLGDGYSTI